MRIYFGLSLLLCMTFSALSQSPEAPSLKNWKRHVIDDSSRGADGTRLADINGDGLPDIATGWEQGGVSRVCIHPGYDNARLQWPSVTVGLAQDVEDAVIIDLDADGAKDVVSCCEGTKQSIVVHWSHGGSSLDSNSWITTEVPASQGMFRWMFATPMDVDGDGRMDLVAGGKGAKSKLGWWKIPEEARDTSKWRWYPLRNMGWLMSLEVADMNEDGYLDLLFTDRKGGESGLFWLENPGPIRANVLEAWTQHQVGGLGEEVMFFSQGNLDDDPETEIVVAVRPNRLLIFDPEQDKAHRWKRMELLTPTNYGTPKATAVADFNLDGKSDLVFSTENASEPKMGIGLFVASSNPEVEWSLQSISGVDGVKHDLVVPVDLDGDGDLDILTCEEVKNLGVIWYENPAISLSK